MTHQPSKKAQETILTSRLRGFPEPRLQLTDYGFEQAVCVVCDGHYQLAGYSRHYKLAHVDPPRPVVKRGERIKRPRRSPSPHDIESEPMGDWYWKKLSNESMARILASYKRQG